MMALPQTAGSTVFQNQNHIWWESCPPLFENAFSRKYYPEMGGPGRADECIFYKNYTRKERYNNMTIYEAIDAAQNLIEYWRWEDREKTAYYEGVLHALNWIADGRDNNAANPYRIFTEEELQYTNI